MLRTFAILLLIAVAINARAAPQKSTEGDNEATETVPEESTYISVEDGTITVDVDSDLILTTSPEGETFTEAGPVVLTEEPLPDSVVQQLEMERAQEEQLKNPEKPESEVESESEELDVTTTEQPNPNNTESTTKKIFKFGATTLPPYFITTTGSPKIITTISPQVEVTNPSSETEETTEYQEVKTMKNYFERKPALMGDIDLDMAENRMETTTHTPAQEPIELSMIVTTEAALVEENVKAKSETDQAELVETTVVPLYQYFNKAARIVTESQDYFTTVVPRIKEEEVATEPATEETTELPRVSSTPIPETTTEAELTTTPAPTTTTTTTTETALVITKVETLLNVQPETTTSAPETTTTRAPETTTTSAPETTIPSAPETTTSSAPETTTTHAPETTTTSAPEITTTTFSVPESTTTASTTTSTSSTTSAPTTTTTTTTTERPIQTRAPRVERIFNSDGVEVLYGYSSVVRTNRS
ncbi:mucin-5AC [Drosophila eugracilis]|uniref:mucin-5AC n=1 Tax=Drosophila eugracilis TaxID=29029 RepID=UPI001BD9CB94|nr:mucin-5AC [Drosophila eugracilis]